MEVKHLAHAETVPKRSVICDTISGITIKFRDRDVICSSLVLQ